ncbi:MAG: dienelactone hydrolase family protein [Aeoliella sp.]
MIILRVFAAVVLVVSPMVAAIGQDKRAPVLEVTALEGTAPFEMEGDIASQLVDAADRFLLDQLRTSANQRAKFWQRDLTSPSAYTTSLAPNRQHLKEILGLDGRQSFQDGLDLVTTTLRSAIAGEGPNYSVFVVRWPAFGDVNGEGLLLTPKDREPIANVIALPHCDVTPEQLCGLVAGVPPAAQYARRLAESGCRVVVPALIDRNPKHSGITNREWLHRSAYEMGRTMTGYEVNKSLAVVDWFEQSSDLPIGVIGWGDGGMLAGYAAAVDVRIDAACVSGAFGDLENLWQQPIDRMLFGLLKEFGDAELASMLAPRHIVVEHGIAPESHRPRLEGESGGPYRLARAAAGQVTKIAVQARGLAPRQETDEWLTLVRSDAPGSTAALSAFLNSLSPDSNIAESGVPPRPSRDNFASDERRARQMHEIDRHTQSLLRSSHLVREKDFWEKLDTSSLDAYQKSVEPFRKAFYEKTIGRFEIDLVPSRVKSRLIDESSQWKRYEVTLNVFDGLFAYGILTIPNGIAPGDRRPVVVCQHGLEGRPQSVIGDQDKQYYRAFATELAEQGFVTFAPQNLYIFGDRFRTLQRKANCIGKTLFSIITPQHQQIVNWLKLQPYVDADRVAFYGLSYGGKTAMRVPPLVTDYCLAICSADFNEWVDKNASTQNPRSYVNSGEYEIFEWNLGHTFNYAEMAALIAPRPFMVERGHFDGVADDWTVAWEYARVRHLYAARLKRPELTEIEWFDGPHAIHGQATYRFLQRHLE